MGAIGHAGASYPTLLNEDFDPAILGFTDAVRGLHQQRRLTFAHDANGRNRDAFFDECILNVIGTSKRKSHVVIC